MKNLSMKRLVKCWLPAVSLLLFFCAASAPAQLIGYPGKVICGLEVEPGPFPLLSDPNPLSPPRQYENLKPGNYATVFSILNLSATTQTVSFLYSGQNQPPVLISTISITAFSSVSIGCEEIFNLFVPPLIGQRIMGSGIVVATTENLDVSLCITTESMDYKSEHKIHGDITGEGFAASGAGGLGLGISIDVERLEAVELPAAILEEPGMGTPEG